MRRTYKRRKKREGEKERRGTDHISRLSPVLEPNRRLVSHHGTQGTTTQWHGQEPTPSLLSILYRTAPRRGPLSRTSGSVMMGKRGHIYTLLIPLDNKKASTLHFVEIAIPTLATVPCECGPCRQAQFRVEISWCFGILHLRSKGLFGMCSRRYHHGRHFR
jgi:hypothetical protein